MLGPTPGPSPQSAFGGGHRGKLGVAAHTLGPPSVRIKFGTPDQELVEMGLWKCLFV